MELLPDLATEEPDNSTRSWREVIMPTFIRGLETLFLSNVNIALYLLLLAYKV